MKTILMTGLLSIAVTICCSLSAQNKTAGSNNGASTSQHLFIDRHQLDPGKVTLKDIEGAHKKDLAVEQKYNVQFLKYWFDQQRGIVYCLALADDSESIRSAHAEAHGLLPEQIYPVTSGKEATALTNIHKLFLDVHNLGAGNVTAAAVADAHKKDLEVQKKYGVNLINYWVDERDGVVMCLGQAKDSSALINTHREAHGLLPLYVSKVKEGQ